MRLLSLVSSHLISVGVYMLHCMELWALEGSNDLDVNSVYEIVARINNVLNQKFASALKSRIL
jgi:hypothetical protein